ncbi:hypothetical protein D9M72_356660 [compost metagenome]
MHEEGGNADVQGGEERADDGHQRRRAHLECGLQGQADGGHAEQCTTQHQGHLAQAAEEHGAEAQGQQHHQRRDHGETQQDGGGAGMEGVHAEEDAVGALSGETQAQVVGQVRVEQGVGDHPEDVEAEMLDVGAGGDAGGDGHIGQYPRVVLTQHGCRSGGVEQGGLHGLDLSLVLS